MSHRMRRRLVPLLTLVLGVVSMATVRGQDIPLDRLRLPEGFRIEVFASGVENARQMALSQDGTLFVSTRRGWQRLRGAR